MVDGSHFGDDDIQTKVLQTYRQVWKEHSEARPSPPPALIVARNYIVEAAESREALLHRTIARTQLAHPPSSLSTHSIVTSGVLERSVCFSKSNKRKQRIAHRSTRPATIDLEADVSPVPRYTYSQRIDELSRRADEVQMPFLPNYLRERDDDMYGAAFNVRSWELPGRDPDGMHPG